MTKSAEAFRSIGEVANLIGVAPHVLRYWETQFPLLKPMKRPDGRRYYRPADLALAAGLVELLRDQGLTIRGARMALAADRGEAVRARGTARLAQILADAPDPGPASGFAGERTPETSSDRVRPAIMPAVPARPADAAPAASPDISLLPSRPDRDVAADQASWLARLTAIARRLQRVTPSEPRWSAQRATAQRLVQAMIRIS